MRLYLLRLGTVRGEDLPITAALIRHPSGANVLVDTGAPLEMTGSDDAPFAVGPDENVLARLAELGLTAEDIDYVVGTHMDPDHAGSFDAFPHSRIVVQRREYEAARESGAMRYEWQRAHWDVDGLDYLLVDGDTTLLDGIELVDSRGHSPGHQSVLVRLPGTGAVLLTGDAIPSAADADPDRPASGYDHAERDLQRSTRRLLELDTALIIYSHDQEQWKSLRLAPGHYD